MTTATVQQDGLSAVRDNPFDGNYSPEQYDDFEATNTPIPLTEWCEPESKIQIDFDKPIYQERKHAPDNITNQLIWFEVEKERHEFITDKYKRIAYTPIKEVSKETLPTESHIAGELTEAKSFNSVDEITQQGQTVEEAAASKYPLFDDSESSNYDQYSKRHGYVMGFTDCNKQWVKDIEDRIKELCKDGYETSDYIINELSSLLKQFKGE